MTYKGYYQKKYDQHIMFNRPGVATVLLGEIEPKRSVPTNFHSFIHLLPILIVSLSLRNIQRGKVVFLALNMNYYCFKSNLIEHDKTEQYQKVPFLKQIAMSIIFHMALW